MGKRRAEKPKPRTKPATGRMRTRMSVPHQASTRLKGRDKDRARLRSTPTKPTKPTKPKKPTLWTPLIECIPPAPPAGDTDAGAGTNTDIDWVSGTTIRNYMLNDPIIDWLERYYVELGLNDGNPPTDLQRKKTGTTLGEERRKMNPLFENGIEFEEAVFEELRRRFPGEVQQVGHTREDVTPLHTLKTVEHMKQGVPIILQAVLVNEHNKTRGMADVLVRSDYINRIFGEDQLTESEANVGAPGLGTEYHYRVLDIKWSGLHLCADGKLIRNGERVPAYKGQLAIYNSILGHLQGYYPDRAYILGHSWRYEMCGNKFSGHSCFDLLGHIDYAGFDRPYISRTAEAINWIRDLRRNGATWKLIPPSIPLLYPNMSNSNDAPWHAVKDHVACQIQELTQLWQVGPKNRAIAHANGLFSWSDPNCTATNLGIRGKKIGPTLDRIIEINQQSEVLVSPPVIRNNLMNWQTPTELDFYVDFETLNGCFTRKPTTVYDNRAPSNIIFLIGVWCRDVEGAGAWRYHRFRMQRLKIEDEATVIDSWCEFIDSRVSEFRRRTGREGRPRFFHWSNAEVTSFNIANRRHQNRWTRWLSRVVWIDLCRIFQTEPIVVHGALRFKLKDVAKSFHRSGLIPTTWDQDGIADGLSAMIDAIEYYKLVEAGVESDIMEREERYNEKDCRVMQEMVDYLRAHHTGRSRPRPKN